MRPPRCGCAHADVEHAAGGGPCLSKLDEDLAVELPAWRCPCRRYRHSTVATALTVRNRTVGERALAV